MTDQFFVLNLITELERNHGLKIFVPLRDNLKGGSDNTVCAQLIEHRGCGLMYALKVIGWPWCCGYGVRRFDSDCRSVL
ncbi:hypothetical protein DPMN_101134 [Dreissena polymorpha]|uniref:Uncharacterized protein n=1 Tax=Dreissena polymorpha TaxID=45954 RepID=A0A9D4R819_DREPO|nr:hypothetical protein DPMN_101134 [Dreissena polymorpha]